MTGGKSMSRKKGRMPMITWSSTAFLWLIFAMNANSRELFNRVSPQIVETYHLNSTQLSTVIAIASLAMAIGAIPLTVWAQRGGHGYRRHKRSFILALGYLIPIFICGMLGMYAVGAGFSVFAIMMVIRGIFNACGESCEVAQVQEWAPLEKQGIIVGFQHTGYPWGSLIGGLATTAIMKAFGYDKWGIPFMGIAVIAVVIWLIWKRVSTKSRYEKFEEQCIENGLTPPLRGLDVSDGAESGGKSPARLADILKNPNIIVFSIAGLVQTGCYGGISYWLTPYVTYIGHYDAAKAASLGVLFTITGGLGQIFWGHVADRVGTKRIAQLCFVWLAIAFVLLKYSYMGLFALVGLQLLFGFVINALAVICFSGAAISAGPGASALSNSLVTTGMYVGTAVSTIIVGRFIDLGGGWESVAGYNRALIFMVAAIVAVIVIISLFTRETNGKRLGKDFSLVSTEKCNLTRLLKKEKEEQNEYE